MVPVSARDSDKLTALSYGMIAVRLAAAIKSVLRRAIARNDSRGYRGSRFRVYDREGERCPTRGCRGTIERIWQAGRSTFYCPVCQR